MDAKLKKPEVNGGNTRYVLMALAPVVTVVVGFTGACLMLPGPNSTLFLFVSTAIFISGVITHFTYGYQKHMTLLVWSVAAAFCGTYLLLGTLIFHFNQSLLFMPPILGLAVLALGVVSFKKILGVAPTPQKAAQPSISIQLGEGHIIEGGDPARAYELLKNLSDKGMPSLCVTSTHLERVKQKYGLEKVKMIWLTKKETKNAISPMDLDILRDAIEEFTKQNKDSIVLLDGVEYLITTNGFEQVLRFLHDVDENIALQQAGLIVPLNPKTLEERQLAMLERDKIVEKL